MQIKKHHVFELTSKTKHVQIYSFFLDDKILQLLPNSNLVLLLTTQGCSSHPCSDLDGPVMVPVSSPPHHCLEEELKLNGDISMNSTWQLGTTTYLGILVFNG